MEGRSLDRVVVVGCSGGVAIWVARVQGTAKGSKMNTVHYKILFSTLNNL